MALPCSKLYPIQNPKIQNPAIIRTSRAMEEPLQLKHASARRDAMVCLTASLFTTLFPVGAVEARSTKAENKRRVKEKLDKLREKAEASKPKTDSGSAIGKNKSEAGQSTQLIKVKNSLLEVLNPQ